jgi:hypothetical protein
MNLYRKNKNKNGTVKGDYTEGSGHFNIENVAML